MADLADDPLRSDNDSRLSSNNNDGKLSEQQQLIQGLISRAHKPSSSVASDVPKLSTNSSKLVKKAAKLKKGKA